MRSRSAVVVAFASILVCAVILLGGCSGGNSTISGALPSPGPTPIVNPSPSPGPPGPTPTPSPNPSPSPTPTPAPTVASRFIYGIIKSQASGGYFGGAINGNTGAVTPLPQSFPNTLGQNVVAQVITDPQARFLYSLNLGSAGGAQPGINEYQINQTNGVLTPVSANPIIFSSGTHNAQLAIDGNGKFLYQPDGGVTDIYSIDQTTGVLIFKFSTTAAVPVGTFSAASPDGRFIFNSGGGMVETFAINDVTGGLTLVSSPTPAGGSGGPISISADSSLLFVASPEGRLGIFHVGANGLTPLTGSPFVINTQAEAISLSPAADFAYITFGQPGNSNVIGYAVNTTAGTLIQISGGVIGAATSISVDGSGKFAYVSLGRQLVTFTIDQATGALTQTTETAVQPFTDDPTNIVLIP